MKVSKPVPNSVLSPCVSVGGVGEGIIRVLHVDDYSSFFEVIELILEQHGPFRVECASSVDEAFVMLGAKEFDVVVSDYQMPVKDVLQFLRELRARGNNIPFILFTGKGREEVAIKELNLGADYYINKIDKPETVYGELAHVIHQVVKNKESENRLLDSEEKFRTIFEGATDGILAADTENQRFAFANPKMCELTGYSLEELSKLFVAAIHPRKDLPYVNEQFAKQAEGKIALAIDIPILRKNNQILYCDVNSVSMKIGKKQLLAGFFRNITDRKKIGASLRESEKRLNKAQEIGYGTFRTI